MNYKKNKTNLANFLSRKNKKKLRGYSLVEIVVSLGVIGIVIAIFFNALIISMQVSVKNLARSNLREEISGIVDVISRDIHAAELIISCTGETCDLVIENLTTQWAVCNNHICKYENGTKIFESSEELNITQFTFEEGFSDSNSLAKNNILITLIGSHSNENLNINNLTRQTTASTRNYEL